MSRRHRLRGRSRFAGVRRVGVEARSGHVRIRAQRNNAGVARAGIAVANARCAVERNRARRVLRAALGRAMHDLPSADFVVTVSAENAAALADVATDVQRALTVLAGRLEVA